MQTARNLNDYPIEPTEKLKVLKIQRTCVHDGPGINDIFEPYIERFEQKMLNYVTDELNKAVQAGFFRKYMDIDVMANIIVGAFLRIAYHYFIVKKGKRKKPSIEHISEEFFKLITKGLQSPVMF
jgi:hypothetical protein